MSEILELKNISKYYGKTKVLENINLKIKNNEFFTILGSSGSGKSTIIRMIGGFVKPSAGEIIFEDKIINFSNEYICINALHGPYGEDGQIQKILENQNYLKKIS